MRAILACYVVAAQNSQTTQTKEQEKRARASQEKENEYSAAAMTPKQ